MSTISKNAPLCIEKSISPNADDALSKRSKRDSIFTKRRNEAAQIEDVARAAGLQNLAEKIRYCSPVLEFEEQQIGDTTATQYKLKRAFFCRKRFCSVCTWRRSLMWKAKFLTAVPEITKKHPPILPPTYYP